jgi:hypothetical protein
MSERWRKFPSSDLLIICSTFSLLYSFFWMIFLHFNFICRRFGTLCLFHHHKWHKFMKMEQSVPEHQNIKFRCREITQKKKYNIQNTWQILKSSSFILYMNLFRNTEESEYLSLLFTFLLLPWPFSLYLSGLPKLNN